VYERERERERDVLRGELSIWRWAIEQVYYNRYVVKKTETAATLRVRKKRGIGAEI
jgi:hypothetical protein